LVPLPLFLYHGVAGIASATDNRVVMFLGNLEEGVVPFVLPDDAFGRLSNAEAVNVTIDTNAHHAAYAALGAGVNHIPTIANNNTRSCVPFGCNCEL